MRWIGPVLIAIGGMWLGYGISLLNEDMEITKDELTERGFGCVDKIPEIEIGEFTTMYLIEAPSGWHVQISEEPEFSGGEIQTVNLCIIHTVKELDLLYAAIK